MEVNAKEFSNDDITVTYDPCICKLSGKCAKELSDVFSNTIIPWINLDNSETDQVIKQIKKCPSGALQYFLKKEKQAV
ncbi:(4Fe-4S)-binding protein [Aestuariivivens sediminis]|uniref:(4Fe-4S)-binding protein n=1 Tax=Aestuariivivens sediminis TaxID=2913557 RepID=UPI001F5ABBA1|nr:(4Fe-4S)-binding protein [Aestuariivivens sediminis]